MAIRKKMVSNGDVTWEWEGKDRSGKRESGELSAPTERVAKALLLKRGIVEARLKKPKSKRKKKITEKDIVLFSRQLATMMKAGVPLLQAFDIAAYGHSNPSVTAMLKEVRIDIESGLSLGQAFARKPKYFDKLFCNLVAAGEAGGVLDSLLDKLATYKEKMLKIKKQIKSALIYPISILVIAFIVTAVIMIFVVPAFKELFEGFGADLPIPTLVVIWISEQFVQWWWLIFGLIFAVIFGIRYSIKNSVKMQERYDIFLLKLPLFGEVIRKSTISRWVRTLATLFTAGVPLVEALDSVGGASGNYVYAMATKEIQADIASGSTLTDSMKRTGLFQNMVVQMAQIGEESGSLDTMLEKVADFYDDEVDAAVAGLKSLMEPAIMVILGVLIGGLVIAMYLPIFKMGEATG